MNIGLTVYEADANGVPQTQQPTPFDRRIVEAIVEKLREINPDTCDIAVTLYHRKYDTLCEALDLVSGDTVTISVTVSNALITTHVIH